jgi:hypothetical protein
MKLAQIIMAATFTLLLSNRAGVADEVRQFHLDEATIDEVHAAYRDGATSATRLVQAYLERIQAYDQVGPNCE